MRIFKTRPFSRWASGQLTNAVLRSTAQEMIAGLIDVNLGGSVYKKRVAVPGRGKRGSTRTLVAFRSGDRAIFMYGFAKNQRTNIKEDELKGLKKLAKEFLAYSDGQLTKAVQAKELIEV